MTAAPLLIGHRGAPGRHLEHTWPSYARALDDGVDAVEPDVVMTSDGVPVVLHETELSATTDISDRAEFASLRTDRVVDGRARSGWFTEDLTFDQLRTLRRKERWSHLRPDIVPADSDRVLSLAELIERLDAHERAAQIQLVIELKHSAHLRVRGLALEDAVLRVLAEARPRRAIVESFEVDALLRMREGGFDDSLALLVEVTDARTAALRAGSLESLVPPPLRDDLAYLSVDKDLLLSDPVRAAQAVARLHDDGRGLLVWTLRPENVFLRQEHRLGGGDAAFGDYEKEWRILRDLGVDGVFVDHPDLARSAGFTGGTIND